VEETVNKTMNSATYERCGSDSHCHRLVGGYGSIDTTDSYNRIGPNNRIGALKSGKRRRKITDGATVSIRFLGNSRMKGLQLCAIHSRS